MSFKRTLNICTSYFQFLLVYYSLVKCSKTPEILKSPKKIKSILLLQHLNYFSYDKVCSSMKHDFQSRLINYFPNKILCFGSMSKHEKKDMLEGMESGLNPVRKSPVFLRNLKFGLLGPKSRPKQTFTMDQKVQYSNLKLIGHL